MAYRAYGPPEPLLVPYDPFYALPQDHLCRLVEEVVEESIEPDGRWVGPGQPAYDPRLVIKVLVYGYATGVRSSRALEANCREHLAYLFLTRGAAPSYRTMCTVRTQMDALIERVWVGLFEVASEAGIERIGRIVVDSSKWRANASAELVVAQEEYAAVLAELERILAEARETDAREDAEGRAGSTQLGKSLKRDQMRDILRRVRKQLARSKRAAPEAGVEGGGTPEAGGVTEPAEEPEREGQAEPCSGVLSPQMLERVEVGVASIKMAQEEGLKHACLTDPDARMMGEGREKKIRECHSWEIAVDNELVVAGQRCPSGTDNGRLGPLVEAARKHEPQGVQSVDADSGYYRGGDVALLIQSGIDTCVPDSNTAADLHRGQAPGTLLASTRGSVRLEYEADLDQYRCPEGNVLTRVQWRQHGGQRVHVYRAQRECAGCPLASTCLSRANARYRTIEVCEHHEILEEARQRFAEPEHAARYSHRGEAVETVFAVLRSTLGYTRWLLRGDEKVECEGRLFKVAYQLRKVHRHWSPRPA